MKTCSDPPLALPLSFCKPVLLDFGGGDLSSDAGWAPLALADRRHRLVERLSKAIHDGRDPNRVDHSLLSLLRERVYLIAQGYADANDANTLRRDPLLQLAVGKEPGGDPLAGQSTLSRLENAVTAADLARCGAVLLTLFLERCAAVGTPQEIVVDFDPFEDPAHGCQQGVLFNGHYDSHCYLPLYLCGSIDGGRQYVLGALLRPGTAAATDGARGLLKRVVGALRARFPQVRIIVRGDAGFGVARMIRACRRLQVDYCFGLGRNHRLDALSERGQMRAALGYTLRQRAGNAKPYRVFREFSYQAGTWQHAERVINKTEVTTGPGRPKLNPRFIVTSLRKDAGWTRRRVYAFYCGRGDPENRIKEFKSDIDAGRLSCHAFPANQFRLLLHAAAYALYQTVQDTLAAVAPATEWATAQVSTLRARLFKVAARVVVRCRVVRVHLPSSYPWQVLWRKLVLALVMGPT